MLTVIDLRQSAPISSSTRTDRYVLSLELKLRLERDFDILLGSSLGSATEPACPLAVGSRLGEFDKPGLAVFLRINAAFLTPAFFQGRRRVMVSR